MNPNKLRRVLSDSFGAPPEVTYFAGDMSSIRSYFDQRSDEALFSLDDDTWDDLNMDAVFRSLNPGLSTSGEQCLYRLLRTPAASRAEFGRRASAIDLMERAPALRLDLQCILARLGRRGGVDLCALLRHGGNEGKKGLLYLALSAGLLLCLALLLSAPSVPTLAAFFCFAVLNPIVHHVAVAAEGWRIPTVEYCTSMLAAIKAVLALRNPSLALLLERARQALAALRGVPAAPAPSNAVTGDLAELFNHWLLTDLISFEYQKKRFAAHQDDLLAVHEALGGLDAAIAAASFRKRLGTYAVPRIGFEAVRPRLRCADLIHPLVKDCVPNSVDMGPSLLVTGSNATGKSTFLRAVAVNVVLAQSLCTAAATDYGASFLRLYSSISVTDSLLAGESAYTAELRSLRRIADAAMEAGGPILCVVDEPLRGTNTIERIAASSELLTFLGERTLCIAATHDGELCPLLDGLYAPCHFQEQVTGCGMAFDHLLRPGPGTSCNAIRLLSRMGFPPELADHAQSRAQAYRETRIWRK